MQSEHAAPTELAISFNDVAINMSLLAELRTVRRQAGGRTENKRRLRKSADRAVRVQALVGEWQTPFRLRKSFYLFGLCISLK